MQPDPNSGPSTVTNDTTVGELRQQYGEDFAPGYGNTDKLGQVLGRAGVSTLEEFLSQHRRILRS